MIPGPQRRRPLVMELNVRGLNFDLTDAILGHVRQRLADGLAHYAPRLRGVTVRVSDVNGPRGGMDKRCHLEVTVPGAGAVSGAAGTAGPCPPAARARGA